MSVLLKLEPVVIIKQDFDLPVTKSEEFWQLTVLASSQKNSMHTHNCYKTAGEKPNGLNTARLVNYTPVAKPVVLSLFCLPPFGVDGVGCETREQNTYHRLRYLN